MADISDPYVFRVIRGRIVPIKITGEQRELRQELQYKRKKARYHEKKKAESRRYGEAAAYVAGGIGLVLGAKFGAGKLTKYAKTQIKNINAMTKGINKFGSRAAKESFEQLRKKALWQSRLVKNARTASNVLIAPAGAAIAAMGVEKGIETFRGKPLSNRERVATFVGAAATAGGVAAFNYGQMTGRGRKITWLFNKIGIGFGK
jgi:hypothetical protein